MSAPGGTRLSHGDGVPLPEPEPDMMRAFGPYRVILILEQIKRHYNSVDRY